MTGLCQKRFSVRSQNAKYFKITAMQAFKVILINYLVLNRTMKILVEKTLAKLSK